MAVLAVLSYRHVKQQLYRQSENRLQQANVALGQAIFERLLLLDATLKSIPPQAILQLDVSKRKPQRLPQPTPRVTPRLGNQTQTGNMDGRVAMGGIVLDRDSPLPTRPAPIARRADRGESGPDRGARPAGAAAVRGGRVRRRRRQAHRDLRPAGPTAQADRARQLGSAAGPAADRDRAPARRSRPGSTCCAGWSAATRCVARSWARSARNTSGARWTRACRHPPPGWRCWTTPPTSSSARPRRCRLAGRSGTAPSDSRA